MATDTPRPRGKPKGAITPTAMRHHGGVRRFVCPDELWALVQERADALGVSPSEWVRRVLRAAAKRKVSRGRG